MSGFASTANTYQWNDANGIISGETTSTYSATSTGTYSLTVTTSAGCSSTSSGLAVSIITVSTPTGMYASNIQLDRGTMNWSAVANANHYDIRMRAQGSATWTILMLNLPNTSQQKTGLASSTTYEWEVRSACSTDSSFVSAWSSVQSFTTLTPCGVPTNLDAINITLTSADLVWDAVVGALGYQVRFKQDGSSWGSWVYNTVYVTTLSKTGLLSDTEYEWEVRSFCDSSMITVSAWEHEEFETLEPCGNATNLSVSSLSVSTVQL